MIANHEVTSSVGAVAAEPSAAARVGAQVLADGGNAMDAAAAVSMACCMLQPARTGIGGYVLAAVILEGKTGRVWSLDSNSPAPAGVRADMFDILPISESARTGGELFGINEKEYLCSVKDNANIYGPLSVAIPGMMAGMGTLWERWGRLSWEDIVAPSIKLVEDGFPYGLTASHIQSMEDVIAQFEPTRQHLMPEGRLPESHDIWHRPQMEKTLKRIASAGWRDFYDGEIGRTIADYIQETGGVLTREDMAGYEPRLTEPYKTTYRNAEIYGPILPNGCLSSMQLLNFLECFDVVPHDSVEYWHRLAEVLKLIWRDRLRYLGDPDFIDVPVERLLSKDYAMGRTETIRQFPQTVDQNIPDPPGDSRHGTLHVSAADAEGNVAAVTITHGAAFGSCVTVPGTGIILGHGIARLDPHGGLPNSIAAGKRPLNNVAPMIIRLPHRDVATGVPGGRRIISVGAMLAQRVVDFGATGYEAVSAPRMHMTTHGPVEVTRNLDHSIVDALKARGHQVTPVDDVAGGAHCAEFLKTERLVRAGGNTPAAGVNE